MKLSVILICHSSQHALRQALNALFREKSKLLFEVIVVDNAAGPVDVIASEFPKVHVIANSNGQSISQAYNKAIKAASGDYVLLLSPDVIATPESTAKLADFMDQHPLAGGTSVRIVNYKGDYLSESKHSLGSAWISFLKFTGFTSYFPKSVKVNKNADWIEEFETSEVDVLNADCMLLRRSALNSAGLFDERFTRYGHNIDLSYRLRKKGFKTYYYSKTYIIQLPGTELDKFSWDHIRHYYGAMFIFAAKYLFKQPVINIGEILPSSYEME